MAYQRNNFEHDKYAYSQEKEKAAAIKESLGETQLENKRYARLVQDYLRCSTMYIE